MIQGIRGGTLQIDAYRYLDVDYERISIGGTNISSVGTYIIGNNLAAVNFSDGLGCTYLATDVNVSKSGTLIITRFDPVNNVISGTFNFRLEKSGCPTIIATEGRFDIKIQ